MSRIECAFPAESSTDSTTPAPPPSMIPLSPRRAVSALALLSLLAAPSGCAPPERPVPPPPLVTVARPIQQDVTQYETVVGRTEAVNEIEIRARVQGFLDVQHFAAPGVNVAKDAPLFTIEQDQYQAALDAAKAAVMSSDAELARAEADLRRVKAVATAAISEQEVDLRQADRDKATAQLAAAHAAVAAAQIQFDYTEIKSPIEGRVGRELVSVGNLVGSGENTLLTTVFSMKPLYVYFEVPEIFVVNWVRTRDPGEEQEPYPISIALEGEEGFPHEGYIDYFDNTVNSSTGTILVRGVMPNDPIEAYPGLFVRVQIAREEILEDALLVEEVAIGTDLGGKYVLVIGEDSMVERRGIEVGPAVGQLRTALTGLNPDDTYIVDGIMRARPGRPVQTETRQEAAARAAAQGQRR